ncbi:MAG: L-threonylcarbamoyladenylate synthase [bacterium]|nr:L-threonylcarbamoyladenylate synthase [bacterium]
MLCSITECSARLAADELIAYPTETFWALGCNPCSEVAVQKLFMFKGRAQEKGIPLIISSSSLLADWEIVETEAVRQAREKLVISFWPGSLTMVLDPGARARTTFAPGVVSSDGSIAVRVSPNEYAREVAQAIGGAITSTSLNISGERPVSSVVEAERLFPEIAVLDVGHKVEDAEARESKRPSTIVDVRSLPFKVLRVGSVSVP